MPAHPMPMLSEGPWERVRQANLVVRASARVLASHEGDRDHASIELCGTCQHALAEIERCTKEIASEVAEASRG